MIIYDSLSNTRFFIDTGTAVSVLPARVSQRCLNPILHIYAANNTRLPVYCQRTLKLNLNLRRSFEWTFYVEAVSQAILRADFLQFFNLMVDVWGQKLMNRLTELSTSAKTTSCVSTLLSTINPEHQFVDILRAYPVLLQRYSPCMPVHHNVMHHIETTEPPVHAKVRRLHPGRYKQAKQEFESLLKQSIIHPSCSNWSSAHHVVDKKNGDR